MCGIAGFQLSENEYEIIEERDRIAAELSLFLLDGIESRGRDATGMSWFATKAGDPKEQVWVLKDGIDATKFCEDWRWMGVSGDTAILHTRAATTGTNKDNKNNHPIPVPGAVGVHNGVLWNEDAMFAKYGYERIGEVDSEILFHMVADEENGGIDGLVKEVKGDAAIAWIIPGDDTHTLRMANLGGRPLEFFWTKKGSLIFASTDHAVKRAAERVGLELLWKNTDSDGRYYEVKDGEIVESRKVGTITQGSYHSYGGGVVVTSQSSGRTASSSRVGGTTNEVSFRRRSWPQPLRPTAASYTSGRCPDCGQFSLCVCRFNSAPLPPYPAVDAGWVKATDEGVENGKMEEGFKILGGYRVPADVWQKWVSDICDLDEKHNEDELLSEHVLDGEKEMELDKDWNLDTEVPMGQIMSFVDQDDGSTFYLVKAKNGLDLLTRQDVLNVIKVRQTRETDDSGIYMVSNNYSERNKQWLECGDRVMYAKQKTAGVWEIQYDGSETFLGSWLEVQDGTHKSPAERSAEAFKELNAATTEIDEINSDTQETLERLDRMLTGLNEAEENLMTAMELTNFDTDDELQHAWLVDQVEKAGERKVEYLLHWRSGNVSLLCDDGMRFHYDAKGTEKSRGDGNNSAKGTGEWMVEVLSKGRAVVEEVDLTPLADETKCFYFDGTDVESFDLTRGVGLREWTDMVQYFGTVPTVV